MAVAETLPPLPPRSVDFNELCAQLKKGADAETAIAKATTELEPVAEPATPPVADAKADASKEG